MKHRIQFLRRRRDFITLLGGAAAAWPLAARAQQPAMPVVGFIRDGSAEANARNAGAFRKGLNETGYVEGQNVKVEYHWLEGQYDHLPALVGDLVRRQVAVIATPGTSLALAAKAATTTIPIVFGVGEDPVRLGLVASLARPGGNATGINFFANEVVAKRLRLLRELVPKVARIAVFINPGNPSVAATTIRDVQEAAPTIGLKTQIFNTATIGEINAAFATFERERPDALFVAGDAFLGSRAAQLVTHPNCTRQDTCDVCDPRSCHCWRTDELRNRHYGHVPSSRRLYPQNPQGREARRPADAAIDQIRIRHQHSNGASAGHRGAARAACYRRRGDRMTTRRQFVALLGGSAAWPLEARAQQRDRLRRVAVVMQYVETDTQGQLRAAAFREGLEKAGWVSGRNISGDYLWGVPCRIGARHPRLRT